MWVNSGYHITAWETVDKTHFLQIEKKWRALKAGNYWGKELCSSYTCEPTGMSIILIAHIHFFLVSQSAYSVESINDFLVYDMPITVGMSHLLKMTTGKSNQRTYQKSEILPTCRNKFAYIFYFHIFHAFPFHAKEICWVFF